MKYINNFQKSLNLLVMIFVISSSFDLLSKFHSVFFSIKFSSGTIDNVDVSLFYLVVTTNYDTFKIINTPAIIALLGLIFNITLIMFKIIKPYVKRKREAEKFVKMG